MKPSFYKNAAFTLVEVTLALGITSFCLLAIFGLLPISLLSNRAAIEQTAANGILSAVSADLNATPRTSPLGQETTSQQFAITIPANPVPDNAPVKKTLYFTSNGLASTSLTADSNYLLTISFLPNGPNTRAATYASLQITWPAAADPANAAGSVKTFIALDRN